MKKILIGVAVFVVLGGGLAIHSARWELREPILEVFFLHLNRGRSIFIRTPHGKTILIDGGQNSEILRELTKLLPFYRRRIDTVIMTSASAKSVGGLIDVVERYEVKRVIKPEVMGTSTALESFEKKLRKKKLFPEEVVRGDRFEIDDVKFTVHFPEIGFKYNKTSKPELVLSVEYGTTTLLFLGDVSLTIQKRIMKELEQVCLVEYSHGATKSRVSAELLEKLKPEVIVSTKRAGTKMFEFR